MTASVADLLAGADLLARELAGSATTGESSPELVAAWPRLARAAVRVLDALPLAAEPETVQVRSGLDAVASGRRPLPESGGAAPDRLVEGITLRLGLVADLLVGVPRAVSAVDVAAARRLRASAMAPVSAVAEVTVASLRRRDVPSSVRWTFRTIEGITEPYARLPVGQRAGHYGDVAAVPAGEPSLDAAIASWAKATVVALADRHTVTGTSLMTAAGDALIVAAAAATTVSAAAQLGLLDRTVAGKAVADLREAHTAWRMSASWPSAVRLDGIRPQEQMLASRQLRATITDLMRDGPDWLPATRLHDALGVDRLLVVVRRGMHAVANVAVAHYQAIDTVVRGPGRLWVASAAVTDTQQRAWLALAGGRRPGWVPMPVGDRLATRLATAAEQGVVATSRAMAALDWTAAEWSSGPPERVEARPLGVTAERRALPHAREVADVTPRP